MAEIEFGVSYDGPALATGRMPVRDLAPALLALGELFTTASKLVYPDRKPVALSIKATAEGSFVVQLILESGHAWDNLVDIFGSDGAAALANLRDLVISGGGLFWLIKRLKDRKVVSQDHDAHPGHVILTLDDQSSLEIPADTVTLYKSVEAREKAKRVVEPLNREGIDQVKFAGKPDTDGVILEEGDLPAYDVPEIDSDRPLLDQERELVVEIASVAFTEGNKWRLSDGEHVFFSGIEDQVFLDGVESGAEAFRKGDMLRCRMRVVQSQRAEGLHTEYCVVEVIEHIPRKTQLSFDD